MYSVEENDCYPDELDIQYDIWLRNLENPVQLYVAGEINLEDLRGCLLHKFNYAKYSLLAKLCSVESDDLPF